VIKTVSKHLSVGESFSFETDTLSVQLSKSSAKKVVPMIRMANAMVKVPTYCQIIGQKINKKVVPPGTPITDLVYDPNEKNDCENKILSVHV
jgi:hypothetical protein